MALTTPGDRRAPVPSVIILGTDAVLAASPATPVQLAHACLAAGYTAVVPQSWGDELLATACTQQLSKRSTSPAIHCACPLVANRLLSVGSDLGQFMISLVAPPVATARYVRALYRGAPVRITYVGRCPSGGDESIDARIVPTEFLTMLAEREISLLEQPEVFDSVLPPDRRRHASLPGGLPAPDVLRREGLDRTIVELSGADLPTQLTRELLSQGTALLDLSLRQGCVCSGAAPGIDPTVARAVVAAIEPPRSATPVIDTAIPVKVELPLPRGSRDVADIVAATSVTSPAPSPSPVSPAAPAPPTDVARLPETAVPVRTPERSPVEAIAQTDGEEQSESLRRRAPVASAQRAVSGVMPTSRRGEGGHLPRAYVARRRPSHAIAQMTDEGETSAAVREEVREPPRDARPGALLETVRETPREATARDSAREATRELNPDDGSAEMPRELQRDMPRAIEHSVEPPAPSASSRWASVPAALPMATAVEEVAPTPPREAITEILPPAPEAPALTTAAAPPVVSPAPSVVRETPTPTPSVASTAEQTPAAAARAPESARSADAPPMLRGLRVELLIAAAVGVGLIAGIVAGRRMDHAAAPAAGEADAGTARGATPSSADTMRSAERGRAVSPDPGRATVAAPARRPRIRQQQGASGSLAPQAAADSPATSAAGTSATPRPAGSTLPPPATGREPPVTLVPSDTLTTEERETIERELRVRRARLDSLARRLDSLRPPPEAPPPVL